MRHPDDAQMTEPAAIEGAAPAGAVLAGTLCLMSCYTQHPLAVYAERIAANLAGLAAEERLTAELRAICARLSARWLQIGVEARRRADGGEIADRRRVH